MKALLIIFVQIVIIKYPVGAIETYSIDINGIELIESPDFICEDFYWSNTTAAPEGTAENNQI